ncbi:MAG: hypothetical protein JWN44_1515 [Myxococcales bacterium]|nr:hypothetical protein [Myxococcales bacterium]
MRMNKLSLVAGVALFGLLHGRLANAEEFEAWLIGFNEVPATASQARARLDARISQDESTITFRLHYSALSAPPLVAHIHFGAKATDGGVSFFLCGGGGKPACPSATTGTVTGTVTAADVVGPAAQGIPPGDLADIIRAIRHGVAYANIHTVNFPNGEIRGQTHSERHEDDD